MKKSSPIFAAGWISIPVTARLPYESASGSIGTPASCSACATRWESIACTPPQLARISTVPALARRRIAIARRGDVGANLAEHTAERPSPNMRQSVERPSLPAEPE